MHVVIVKKATTRNARSHRVSDSAVRAENPDTIMRAAMAMISICPDLVSSVEVPIVIAGTKKEPQNIQVAHQAEPY
jgi:tRNA pseudouridine-54 N-methylase